MPSRIFRVVSKGESRGVRCSSVCLGALSAFLLLISVEAGSVDRRPYALDGSRTVVKDFSESFSQSSTKHPVTVVPSRDRTVSGADTVLLAQREASSRRSRDAAADTGGKGERVDPVWRSQELELHGIGIGVGDVDGDGQNEIVVIDPQTVYLYRTDAQKLTQLAEYTTRILELKSVDVAKVRKQGPARIYVSAQNRGSISSFVLEYRNGKLEPVVTDFPYYLRVIDYPTQGPILLGQQKSVAKYYEGPVLRLADKGDELAEEGRFGIPLKIPIFGFTIGDFEGKRNPLIAVYDRQDHLRVYAPDGKRLYLSQDYYGESDVLLRLAGPEAIEKRVLVNANAIEEVEFFRPRISTLNLPGQSGQELLVISHSSQTRRLLNRTKMLDEGQVVALVWNGDAMDEKWRTPKVDGMVSDFAVDTLPGIPGKRLILLERKKTDWLSFLRSRSQVKTYDLHYVISGQGEAGKR